MLVVRCVERRLLKAVQEILGVCQSCHHVLCDAFTAVAVCDIAQTFPTNLHLITSHVVAEELGRRRSSSHLAASSSS